jgi:hypothetical protein
MSDVRDLVGHDLDPEELETLQRVHLLLEEAGPPPELAPKLERAPEPPSARVIPFARRYRFTLVAAAAVTAGVLFGLGYLVGAAGEPQQFQTVVMTGADSARGDLIVFDKDAAGNWPMEIRVTGLEPTAGERPYELWLTEGGELSVLCGSFLVAPGGTTVAPMNAPYRLKEFDGWVVVEEGSTAPLLTT